jgi:MFS-type transporter involved in bile tolerance (Atg22 family)
MDGITHVTEYGKGFISYYLYPVTAGHLLFILIYTVFSIYFYKYIFQYNLFKWIYLGSIIIFISSIYGDGIGNPSPHSHFKIRQE